MSETRVRLKPAYAGRYRTGVLVKINRDGLWLILRDHTRVAIPYVPGRWEIVK